MPRLQTVSEVVAPNEQSRKVAAAAARLFAERGYDATSVAKSSRPPVSPNPRSTITSAAKRGSPKSLVVEPLGCMIETMEELLATDLDPVDRLVKMIEAHFEFCREDPHRARFFFSLAFSPMGEPAPRGALSLRRGVASRLSARRAHAGG